MLEQGVSQIPFYNNYTKQGFNPSTLDVLKKNNAIGEDYLIKLTKYMADHACPWKNTLGPVKTIVESGVDVNAVDYYGKTALMYLSLGHGLNKNLKSYTDEALLPDLYKKQPSTENFGYTILNATNPMENPESFRILVSSNDEEYNFKESYIYDSETAYNYSYIDVIEYLISKGADVHKKDSNGQTALSWAAWAGNEDVVKLLIKSGVDVNVSNKSDENTPLMFAVEKGLAKIVKLLIEAKSKVDTKNIAGLTPIQVALYRGDKETAGMLEKAGANTKANVVNKKVSFCMEPVDVPIYDNIPLFDSVADYMLIMAYERKADDMVKKAVEAGQT